MYFMLNYYDESEIIKNDILIFFHVKVVILIFKTPNMCRFILFLFSNFSTALGISCYEYLKSILIPNSRKEYCVRLFDEHQLLY